MIMCFCVLRKIAYPCKAKYVPGEVAALSYRMIVLPRDRIGPKVMTETIRILD